MRYRATSIAASEVGLLVGSVTVQLEDWLNAALPDGEFGPGLDQLTMFVVSVYDEAVENERWAEPRNRLGGFTDPITGKKCRNLSLAVSIAPAELLALDFEPAMRTIGAALQRKVLERPKRVPKGFEYERWARAASAVLGVYGPV